MRLLALFGSAAAGTATADSDLDVAVEWLTDGDLLALVDVLTVITGFDRVDVAVLNGASPTLRARALTGRGLYETSAVRSPSRRWRPSRSGATPRGCDGSTWNGWPSDAPTRRARRRRAAPAAHGGVAAGPAVARGPLGRRPGRGAAGAGGGRRLVQVVVDLAVDINSHLVAATGAPAPETGHDSFQAAAGVGALTADLAQLLAPSAGLRNLLVHRYGDVRLDLLAAGVTATLSAYPRYIQQVSAYLLSLDQ